MTMLGGMCSVCKNHKEIPCVLPNGDYLCHDCVVGALLKRHLDEVEEKCAGVKARLSVVAEMDRAVHRMLEDAVRELDALGLGVEAKVELLVKSGNKTRAIMVYREATKKSLTESKDYVDAVIDRLYP